FFFVVLGYDLCLFIYCAKSLWGFYFGRRKNENSKLLMGLIFCFQMSKHYFENRYISKETTIYFINKAF
ncbi:MAG: hypothetical protein ACK5NP_04975, partial [Pseudanabaena sp.]